MIQAAQGLIFLALHLLVLGICAVALLDVVRRPPGAFTSAGKRTKGFWLAVLGVATAVAFVALPLPGGRVGGMTLFALIAVVAGMVYLVDVKPAITPYSGGGRSRGSRRGGW